MSQPLEVCPVSGPVIVGSGVAGLAVAAFLAPLPCTVLTTGTLGAETSTALAQGGIAAAVGPDDSPLLHAADTMAAGAGLCEPEAVTAITARGPAAIEALVRHGARFDRDVEGHYQRALEGAHSRHRVVHAAGDATGAEVIRALAGSVATDDRVTVRPHARVRELVLPEGRIAGVLADIGGRRVILATDTVVLATGGMGGLFRHTTNPLGSHAQGVVLAARAGAIVRDLEMVQFHPTALDAGRDPMPLISEAVRGAGATLVAERGEEFVDPLAARDVVARAIAAQRREGRTVALDARGIARFGQRFPTIAQILADAGLDPARDLIPVRPAAHYAMGGIATDLTGRTTVPGLYAVGECASTGLHGANRLASNSLLEAVVCANLLAESLHAHPADHAQRPGGPAAYRAPALADTLAPEGPGLPHIRAWMDQHAGVARDARGLDLLCTRLSPWLASDDALIAWLVARSARERAESRGAHYRSDAPDAAPVARHTQAHLLASGEWHCATVPLTPAPADPHCADDALTLEAAS